MPMFGIILISVFTLTHIYVFFRLASIPIVIRLVPRKVLIGVSVSLWGIFFSARLLGHDSMGPLAWVLELVGMYWMGVLFLTFVSIFFVDLVTAFGFLMPRHALSLRGWALAASGGLCLIALFQGLRPPVVQSYDVALKGLPDEMDGTVVVGMSDMHLGSQLGKRWLADRVAQVKAQRPDLIVLLGDIFEGHGQPQGELLSILGQLSAPLGVWAVPGNHEFHHDHGTGMDLMEKAGLHVLRNRWAEVRPGLVLAGVDDFTALRRTADRRDALSLALADRPGGSTILLSHTPWQAERASSAGVDLMLSGHTHGGQIWPFRYLTRLVYPLLEGRYEVASTTVIVCRGTGVWGPRMRLWRPGEILRLTLHSKGNSVPR
jgi:predicted MPP superfamily phosphohydrolase